MRTHLHRHSTRSATEEGNHAENSSRVDVFCDTAHGKEDGDEERRRRRRRKKQKETKNEEEVAEDKRRRRDEERRRQKRRKRKKTTKKETKMNTAKKETTRRRRRRRRREDGEDGDEIDKDGDEIGEGDKIDEETGKTLKRGPPRGTRSAQTISFPKERDTNHRKTTRTCSNRAKKCQKRQKIVGKGKVPQKEPASCYKKCINYLFSKRKR